MGNTAVTTSELQSRFHSFIHFLDRLSNSGSRFGWSLGVIEVEAEYIP